MIIKEDWSDGVKKLIIIDYICIYKIYNIYIYISWKVLQSIYGDSAGKILEISTKYQKTNYCSCGYSDIVSG